MNTEIKAVVQECTKLSDQGAVPFADIVKKLIAAGIERYHADLMRSEKTYYLPDGGSECVPNDAVTITPPLAFSAKDVEAAVRGAQAGTLAYKAFCERVLAAGCVGYHVHITGQRVIYYGRTGDSHTEWFPGAQR